MKFFDSDSDFNKMEDKNNSRKLKRNVLLVLCALLLFSTFIVFIIRYYRLSHQWSEWTPCSTECGPGIQYKIMINENECADTEKCSLLTIDERACNVHCYHGGVPSNYTKECICEDDYSGKCCECKIQDCEMTPWSEWSTCTQTCGAQGTRFRTRNVAKSPACGGAPCSEIFTEEENCNRKCYNNGKLDYNSDQCICPAGYNGECCECKIQDCVMTWWGAWSECPLKCGLRGKAFRTRNVEIAPTCGGTECPTEFSEQKECDYWPCSHGYKYTPYPPAVYLSLLCSTYLLKFQ